MSNEAFNHAEELKVQHEIEEVVNASMHRSLTADEARLVAWAAGVQFKENHHANPQG